MTRLSSFTEPLTVAVIGASGGIGRAMCQLLDDDARVRAVYAFSRREVDATGKVQWYPMDIEDESSISYATDAIGDVQFDLVLVLTGILHSGDRLRPERQLKELSADSMARVFAINTTGPALVAKHLLPRLTKGRKTVFAALSARVGSIGDNRLGGWVSYRASKAALNQVLRTLSIEHARRWPDSVVVALHPGTVDTPLSKPFTGNTPDDKLFTPERAAGYLLDVIDGLTKEDTGGFFAWDGSRIDY
ncbi:MAG: SDR family NAD(P)-dependent oxidoreductase [Woeseiaceae bacterium]|nr:SDR family NAD(P)-dependent oxidoreductase [Woeseiaceae bacterium]